MDTLKGGTIGVRRWRLLVLPVVVAGALVCGLLCGVLWCRIGCNNEASKPNENLFGQQGTPCETLPHTTRLTKMTYRHVKFDPMTNISKLPRLAMVISLNNQMYCEYKEYLSAANCYAAKHGIPLYLETVQLQTDRHYFYSRSLHVQKYLQHYQWILHLDADIAFLNTTKSVLDVLDDTYDLMFAVRENGEVFNAAYFVKNSKFGFDFLDTWLELSDHGPTINFDNGDLLQTLVDYMTPSLSEAVREHRHPIKKTDDYISYTREFQRAIRAPEQNTDHIRIFFPHETFVRTYEPAWPIPYYSKLYEGDFIGHGKHIYNTLDPEYLYCTDTAKAFRIDEWGTKREKLKQLLRPSEHFFNFSDIIQPLLSSTSVAGANSAQRS